MKLRRLDMADMAFAELAGELLRMGIAIRFEARGVSMRPFLREGDVVTVRPVQETGFHGGDVILYVNRAGRAVLHRLLARVSTPGREFQLRVRGDAFHCLEECVPPVAVLGVLTEASRADRVLRVDSAIYRVRARVWQALPPVRRLLAGWCRKKIALTGS